MAEDALYKSSDEERPRESNFPESKYEDFETSQTKKNYDNCQEEDIHSSISQQSTDKSRDMKKPEAKLNKKGHVPAGEKDDVMEPPPIVPTSLLAKKGFLFSSPTEYYQNQSLEISSFKIFEMWQPC